MPEHPHTHRVLSYDDRKEDRSGFHGCNRQRQYRGAERAEAGKPALGQADANDGNDRACKIGRIVKHIASPLARRMFAVIMEIID